MGKSKETTGRTERVVTNATYFAMLARDLARKNYTKKTFDYCLEQSIKHIQMDCPEMSDEEARALLMQAYEAETLDRARRKVLKALGD